MRFRVENTVKVQLHFRLAIAVVKKVKSQENGALMIAQQRLLVLFA